MATNTQNDSSPIWILIPVVLLAAVAYIAVLRNGETIGVIMLWSAKLQVEPFALMFDSAQDLSARLSQLIAGWHFDPQNETPFKIPLAALRAAGDWTKYPVILISLLALYKIYTNSGNDVTERFTRKFTLETLLEHNAVLYPVIRPAVISNVGNMPLDKGEWRIARQPFQYAVEESLLIKEDQPRAAKMIDPVTGAANIELQDLSNPLSLDRIVTTARFEKQVGAPFLRSGDDYLSNCLSMPGIERALMALLMSHGAGDKEKTKRLINQLASSWELVSDKPSDIDGRLAISLDMAGVDEMIRFYMEGTPCPDIYEIEYGAEYKNLIKLKEDKQKRSLGVKKLSRKLRGEIEVKAKQEAEDHASKLSVMKGERNKKELESVFDLHNSYTWVLLTALLRWARLNSGALESFLFLWLRPSLRTLWYALNAEGGRMPWCEAGGIWAHLEAEESLEHPVNTPEVEMAVIGFEDVLAEEDWIASPLK